MLCDIHIKTPEMMIKLRTHLTPSKNNLKRHSSNLEMPLKVYFKDALYKGGNMSERSFAGTIPICAFVTDVIESQ